MVAEAVSGMVQGVEGEIVRVQADISNGLPVFHMIGYLSAEVKEAKERVRTALKNSGIILPAKRIAVNFAPADFRKYGTSFDLGVAAALLAALDLVPERALKDTVFLGELSLDGKLQPVSGVLPIVLKGAQAGYAKCVVPEANEAEAAFAGQIKVYSFSDLKEVCRYLREGAKSGRENISGQNADPGSDLNGEQGLILPGEDFSGPGPAAYGRTGYPPVSQDADDRQETDLSEIKGQKMAKRAMEIAAAGYHNLFLDGPPGIGKSMLASAMPGIMPDMTMEEIIDTTMIYSVKGLLKKNFSLVRKRPFRAPSHAVTMAGMFGGGAVPKPGEISLAHHGVLFLDELPEYSREMIEMFRLPMESHCIRLVRRERNLTFPADFLLVTAANPCPCGYYPDPDRCRCSSWQIEKYQNKISGPILDRMDLFVRCEEMSYEILTSSQKGESSSVVRRRVEDAWAMQKGRMEAHAAQQEEAASDFQDKPSGKIRFNSRLQGKEVEEYCRLDGESARLMKSAFRAFSLTGRSYYKILKIARTIADLDKSPSIKSAHLEEALHFRRM